MKTTAHFCLHLSILLVWLLQISQIRANNYYFEQIALKEGLSTTVNAYMQRKIVLYGLVHPQDWDDLTDMN